MNLLFLFKFFLSKKFEAGFINKVFNALIKSYIKNYLYKDLKVI